MMCTYALQIVQSVQLRAQSTVNTQKLLVHNSGQGKGAESVHASLVDGLGVLVLALELESEVISQMTALVVSAEQPERVGVPDLQRPEVKNAL
jgi:DNA recombination-dependent growth factor C